MVKTSNRREWILYERTARLENNQVIRLKIGENSSKPRCEGRLLVKGFFRAKKLALEKFSLAVKMSLDQVILNMVAYTNLKVE